MTREEHLDWCKQRAREYLKYGDVANAVTSMVSDMAKHPETAIHPALSMLGLMAAQGGIEDARRYIEGFN